MKLTDTILDDKSIGEKPWHLIHKQTIPVHVSDSHLLYIHNWQIPSFK